MSFSLQWKCNEWRGRRGNPGLPKGLGFGEGCSHYVELRGAVKLHVMVTVGNTELTQPPTVNHGGWLDVGKTPGHAVPTTGLRVGEELVWAFWIVFLPDSVTDYEFKPCRLPSNWSFICSIWLYSNNPGLKDESHTFSLDFPPYWRRHVCFPSSGVCCDAKSLLFRIIFLSSCFIFRVPV